MDTNGQKHKEETKMPKGVYQHKKGRVFTLEHRQKLSNASKLRNHMRGKCGILHPRWRGGVTVNGKYVLVYAPLHPYAKKNRGRKNGYVYEHRLVMEKHLGRYMKREEIVHHKNKEHRDNRIENLIIFKNSASHMRYHKNPKHVKDYEIVYDGTKRKIISFRKGECVVRE